MEFRVGHYMGELGEAQSDALGAQLTQLVKEAEILLCPVDPGDDPPGAEGVFANALEVALLNHEVDMAVTSLHDISLTPAEGVILAAVTQRIDAREGLIASSSMPILTLPAGTEVYVDGPRRGRQLRRLRADLVPVVARMRLEGVIAAVRAAEGDAAERAAIVCLADLRWLKKDSMVSDMISTDEMLPAPGQGALGLLVRDGDDAAKKAARIVHHKASYACTLAERTCMRHLGWNAYSPAGAFAHVDEDGLLQLRAVVFDPDGIPLVEAVDSSRTDQAEKLAGSVAEAVLKMGGEKMLQEARGIS